MVMRETVSGGAEACRQKASSHIDRIKATFTHNTTDEDKFHAYLAAFDRAAWAAGRCRENFAGENYCRWTDNPATAEKLKRGEEEGVILLELLHGEMAPLMCGKEKQPLSTVNGTSVKFAECAKIRDAAEADLIRTEATYREKILREELPQKFRDLLARLDAKIASICAPFLFIPDTLWS